MRRPCGSCLKRRGVRRIKGVAFLVCKTCAPGLTAQPGRVA